MSSWSILNRQLINFIFNFRQIFSELEKEKKNERLGDEEKELIESYGFSNGSPAPPWTLKNRGIDRVAEAGSTDWPARGNGHIAPPPCRHAPRRQAISQFLVVFLVFSHAVETFRRRNLI